MRSLITAKQATVLVAIAISVATLPAANSAPAKGGGMSVNEYADRLDSNAQMWDDLADQVVYPANAPRWRRHAADLRAEAARARLCVARYRSVVADDEALDEAVAALRAAEADVESKLASLVADAIRELEGATATMAGEQQDVQPKVTAPDYSLTLEVGPSSR